MITKILTVSCGVDALAVDHEARLVLFVPALLLPIGQQGTLASVLQSLSRNAVTVYVLPPTFVCDEVYSPPKHILQNLALDLYDRVGNDLDVTSADKIQRTGAFTLTKKLSDLPIAFNKGWPPTSTDITNRHRFLHIVYDRVPSSSLVAIVLVDDLGEGSQISYSSASGKPLCRDIWLCARSALQQSGIEWRISLSKLGDLTSQDLEG